MQFLKLHFGPGLLDLERSKVTFFTAFAHHDLRHAKKISSLHPSEHGVVNFSMFWGVQVSLNILISTVYVIYSLWKNEDKNIFVTIRVHLHVVKIKLQKINNY